MKILSSIYISTFLFYHVCDSSTRIEYPAVTIDYHFQKALFLQTGNPDPISKQGKKDLQKICLEIRRSSTYTMLNFYDDTTKLPAPITQDESHSELLEDVAKKEWKEGLEYIETKLFLRVKEDVSAADNEVTLFSCATKNGIRYFHLTYGFLDGYFFVFSPVDVVDNNNEGDDTSKPKVEVKLTALIEPSSKLRKFRNPRHMERVFTNSLNNPRSRIDRDSLCALSATQQFRLCVTVYDAKKPSGLSINYAKEMGHQCAEEWVLLGTEMENAEPLNAGRKYRNEKERVYVVSCYINSDDTPNFYLTSDLVHENSVFVLNPKKTTKNSTGQELAEELTLVVEDNVKDVPVFEHAKIFY